MIRRLAARALPVLLVLLMLLASGGLGAAPTPVRLPTGELLLSAEGARYAVAPDGALVPRLGLLSFFPEGGEALWPLIEAPAWVVQGRLATVLVALPDSLAELRARVRLPSGAVIASARGFALPGGIHPGIVIVATDPSGPEAEAGRGEPSVEAKPVNVYALLFAVPVDAEATPGELWIEGRDGDRSFVSVTRLDVFPAGVVEARVALSSALTTLRTRSDDRARQDQKRLDEATATFTPSAVFHLGAVRHPLPGSVQSAGFGDRRVYEYSNGTTALSTHRGLDLVAPTGTRVTACARGRVILAADLLVTGRTVAIEHLPGLISFSFHLSRIEVSEGQMVEPGDVVGRVGATGLATGAHLHWEVRCQGVAVDPVAALDHALVDKSAIVRIIAAYPSHAKRR